jgi:dipeptidyl aminopeptidase/acylaminoacyl peptidase
MADNDSPTADHGSSPTAFHDLLTYVALPRLAGLAVSPDGTRLVTGVAKPSADGKKYVMSIWEVDPRGQRPARRLTRSAPGESQPAFLPNGDLLFTSRRANPDIKPDDERDEVAALWLLPAGGEAHEVSRPPGGVQEIAVAAETDTVVYRSPVLPGAADPDDDDRRRKARKDSGITAILHERSPVRFWDHDLGPDQSHVFAAGPVPVDDGRRADARDLTPTPEGRVDEGLAISPDGTTAASVWVADDGPAGHRWAIAIIDTATGERLRLIEDPEAGFDHPAFAPDGRSLVCCREDLGTWDDAPDRTLWHVDLDTGAERDLLAGSPLWPHQPTFSPDGTAVFFVADERGRAPVFRVDLADGSVTRLTDCGAYTDLVVARDGAALYALRTGVDGPPTPVRVDPRATDQEPVRVPSPAADVVLPGRLVEVETRADDGFPLRAWLALPHEASAGSPAPLLLWIHGGPMASSNAWSWRWNPWLMVARGYAVLLPDPALSTGYGHEFIQRGWGAWGQRPFTDLMCMTDAACAREDIDDTRTAAMGGSFGGYMANWVATQTDRFRAIVTHASLWHLDQFAGTTDAPSYWIREFGDPLEKQERYLTNSPHLRVGDIRTPMLVIHGDKDYRVPIGEGLRLWYDLCRFEVPAKFLYFPDENHWVLTPGHARVWYETVLAFLADHVHGEGWKRPELL